MVLPPPVQPFRRCCACRGLQFRHNISTDKALEKRRSQESRTTTMSAVRGWTYGVCRENWTADARHDRWTNAQMRQIPCYTLRMQFEPNVFEPVLASGEAVTWTGRPHFVPYLISGVPILIFGTLWGLFDLNFIRHMHGSDMLGFALPFFAIHLFPFWGSILYMLWLLVSF